MHADAGNGGKRDIPRRRGRKLCRKGRRKGGRGGSIGGSLKKTPPRKSGKKEAGDMEPIETKAASVTELLLERLLKASEEGRKRAACVPTRLFYCRDKFDSDERYSLESERNSKHNVSARGSFADDSPDFVKSLTERD